MSLFVIEAWQATTFLKQRLMDKKAQKANQLCQLRSQDIFQWQTYESYQHLRPI